MFPRIARAFWFLICLGVTMPGTACWGGQVFVKIDGIDGDSTNILHRNWIEVQSFSIGLSHPAVLGGGANGPKGKTIAGQLHILKPVDRTSPLLSLGAAAHTPLTQVQVDLELDLSEVDAPPRTSPGNLKELRTACRISLNDVVISSIQIKGDTNSLTEEVGLSFREMSYAVPILRTATAQIQSELFEWNFDSETGGLGTTADGPLVVGVYSAGDGQIALQWDAKVGQSFDVLVSPKVHGTYAPLMNVSTTNNGPLEVRLPFSGAMQFFLLVRRP